MNPDERYAQLRRNKYTETDYDYSVVVVVFHYFFFFFHLLRFMNILYLRCSQLNLISLQWICINFMNNNNEIGQCSWQTSDNCNCRAVTKFFLTRILLLQMDRLNRTGCMCFVINMDSCVPVYLLFIYSDDGDLLLLLVFICLAWLLFILIQIHLLTKVSITTLKTNYIRSSFIYRPNEINRTIIKTE